jgi:hypothetical protein
MGSRCLYNGDGFIVDMILLFRSFVYVTVKEIRTISRS